VRVATCLWLLIALLASACGGQSGTPAPPTAPSPPAQTAPPAPPAPPSPPLTAIVTIRDTGFSPSEVTVALGGRVTFTNADSRPHDMLGGPDHTRLDCAEVDVVGFLVPGQSRETRVFETARVCEFHDHNNLGNPAFQGRIIVR
jgi:plastocyanin